MDALKQEPTVMRLLGLQQPKELDILLYGNMSTEEAREKYPNHNILSYRTIASITWDFMLDEFDLDIIPPSVIIDRTKKPPRAFDQDGSLTSWTMACHNYSLESYGTEKGIRYEEIPTSINPMYTEVRIYHENIMHEITKFFGKRISLHGLTLMLSHVFIHEYIHFIDMYQKYKGLNIPASTDNYENAWAGAMEEFIDYFNQSGTPDNEFHTEKRAIDITKKIWVDRFYGYPSNLSPKIGGQFDLMKRRKDVQYCETANILTYYMAQLAYTFCNNDEIESQLKEKMDIAIGDIAKCAKKLNDGKEKLKFVLID